MMDRPDADTEMLEDDLRNLRTINRYFGGLSALRNAIVPIAMKTDPGTAITILDLATGSGDQPVSIVKTFRGLGKQVHITAVDRNESMLKAARLFASSMDEIQFERHDILELPYTSQSYDIVSCSLAIHHLSRAGAIKLLREMNRISRIGFVVNDLSRSYLGAAAAWLYTRLTTKNLMTRYDSVISVLRSFTKNEIIEMAEEAGVQPVRVFTAPFFRLLVVKEK